MATLRLRRLFRRRFFIIIFCIYSIFDWLHILDIHKRISSEEKLHTPSVSTHTKRIYIASIHFNNGDILKSHWNKAVLDLVDHFGPQNVFVSVFESGSWDDSKKILLDLDAKLAAKGVENKRVEVSYETHKDEMAKEPGDGWVKTEDGKWHRRRIPYLSKLRNKTIKDLVDLYAKGIKFDKVLFLNDVVFTTQDVLNLLDTNGGRYGAACSLDFSKPPEFYDTFALRDTNGQKHISPSWPYFKSTVSRNAILRHEDVPVTSCWNGIVAMPTQPFTSDALQFRGVADSLAKTHLEGSECCLIHADNEMSKTHGVYLNPRVRVGYSGKAYDDTHGRPWMSAFEIWRRMWVNRLRRWIVVSSRFEDHTVRTRVKEWMDEDSVRREPGTYCLVNEMQVLAAKGWAHI
ncbi:hypothetical protein Golomagni_05687 [Golovinomyces magnicellulatus]|nr:hypothetical protein Golomagni_05687 [Golovinomyces magnicellulatus]